MDPLVPKVYEFGLFPNQSNESKSQKVSRREVCSQIFGQKLSKLEFPSKCKEHSQNQDPRIKKLENLIFLIFFF